ncbi:MAG: DUF1963 domain-containing protein [Bacteroidota bacterium]|nr:DUF1963 domain-containing protein [Bacteroidota bacterium]
MDKSELKRALKEQLEKLLLQRSTLLMAAAARPESTQTMSHCGGDPYFETGEQWPVNPNTGQPLELIFQLVNEDNMPWPFPAKIVQFYQNYYEGELPFDEGHEPKDYRLKIYPSIRPNQQVQLPRPAVLPPIGFTQITVRAEPSLPDDDELEVISPATQALCQQLEPDDWQVAYNSAVDELIGEQDFGSWVGGYALWLQGDNPTGKFWLEFDSTDDFSWGDAGLLYFFSDPANPLDISFQLQCC